MQVEPCSPTVVKAPSLICGQGQCRASAWLTCLETYCRNNLGYLPLPRAFHVAPEDTDVSPPRGLY